MKFLKQIKNIKTVAVFLIIFLFLIFILSRGCVYKQSELEYGITFSAKQARALGIDWQAMYSAILDDLGAKKLRLSAYWDEVEPAQGNFDWSEIDWQVAEAEKRGASVILAVGGRLPRWPECHFPAWAMDLSKTEREERVLNYIEKTINHLKANKNISAWQIENEPFLPNFGECPKLDKDFLDREAALVKAMDQRPIMMTDSGELSIWVPAAKRADIFGTTMYRDTYSQVLERYIHYPIEPGFFRFKKNIARLFANPKKWIVAELQAEPWGPRPYQQLTQAERDKTMNLEKFKDILEFSRKTGFKEFYLWGAEWWYWEREINNNPEIWNEAKKLF